MFFLVAALIRNIGAMGNNSCIIIIEQSRQDTWLATSWYLASNLSSKRDAHNHFTVISLGVWNALLNCLEMDINEIFYLAI